MKAAKQCEAICNLHTFSRSFQGPRVLGGVRIRARHSGLAGVSLVYLMGEFAELAYDWSGEDDPTFLRLKEAFGGRTHFMRSSLFQSQLCVSLCFSAS